VPVSIAGSEDEQPVAVPPPRNSKLTRLPVDGLITELEFADASSAGKTMTPLNVFVTERNAEIYLSELHDTSIQSNPTIFFVWWRRRRRRTWVQAASISKMANDGDRRLPPRGKAPHNRYGTIIASASSSSSHVPPRNAGKDTEATGRALEAPARAAGTTEVLVCQIFLELLLHGKIRPHAPPIESPKTCYFNRRCLDEHRCRKYSKARYRNQRG
jgi:hypothetical protein